MFIKRMTQKRFAREEKPPPIPCPFCGGEATSQECQEIIDGWLWGCSCGALGLSCIPPDLDEAADQFLRFLKMEGATFSAPPVPVGQSGMLFAQPYDSPRTREELDNFFRRRGDRTAHYEVDVTYIFPDGREQSGWCIWYFWVQPAS